MTLSRFVAEHPYSSSLQFLAIVLCVVLSMGMLNGVYLMGNLVQLAGEDLLLAAMGIYLLVRLGWWQRAGYLSWIRLTQVPLFLLPIAAALLSLAQGARDTAPLTILLFAALTLLVGFAEETFFRGLIFTTLLPTGTLRATVLSSLVFAAPHLFNILGGTWDPVFTVTDSIAAFGLGVTFAALRVRTGSIWPLVGLHALFDFSSLVALGGIDVSAQSPDVLLTTAFIGIIFVVYGFLLLRGVMTGTKESAGAG